jgi:hypothetical protein
VANAAALTMEEVAKRSPNDCDFDFVVSDALLVVLSIEPDVVSVLRSNVEAMNNLVVEQDEEGEDHWVKGIHAKAGVPPNRRRGIKSVSFNADRVGMEQRDGISMAYIDESRQYNTLMLYIVTLGTVERPNNAESNWGIVIRHQSGHTFQCID